MSQDLKNQKITNLSQINYKMQVNQNFHIIQILFIILNMIAKKDHIKLKNTLQVKIKNKIKFFMKKKMSLTIQV